MIHSAAGAKDGPISSERVYTNSPTLATSPGDIINLLKFLSKSAIV
jgi:hypothetical protein